VGTNEDLGVDVEELGHHVCVVNWGTSHELDDALDVAPDDLVNDDIILQGSFSYTSEAFTEVVRRVNARELRPSFLITHRYGLEQASDAIKALRSSAPGEPRGKVIITVASY